MEDAMLIAKNLRRLIYESGQSPAEVARGMNISKTTLSNWMTGYRTPRMYNIDAIAEYLGVSREAIVGTGEAQKDTVKIPIYGYVRAGIPSTMITDILDDEEIPAAMARCGEYFGLRIKGKSMEPVFIEGDNIIVKRQPDVDSGDVAVVAVNGEDATVKVVKKTSSGIMLVPKNHDFEPLFFTYEEVQKIPVTILGKVVELRRKL